MPEKRSRRVWSILLMVLGAVLFYFSLDSWGGVLLIALGVAVEVAAAMMRRSKS